MREKVLFWVTLTAKVVMWILSVLAIYWIILKLTDHSPASDQVMLTVLSIIASGVFGLIALVIHFLMRFSHLAGKMDRHMHDSDRRFDRIEAKLEKVDERFQKIDERFDRVEHKIDRCLACRNFKAA